MTNDRRSEIYDPILDYPEFAATLGMLASQSAYLETQLAELFCHIAGTDPHRGDIIYWFLPSFDRRRLVMERIIEVSELSFKARAKAIVRRAKTFMRFRNECVHNLWHRERGGSPLQRITVNLIKDKDQGSVTIKLKEMRQRIRHAIALNADLSRLINDIETGNA